LLALVPVAEQKRSALAAGKLNGSPRKTVVGKMYSFGVVCYICNAFIVD